MPTYPITPLPDTNPFFRVTVDNAISGGAIISWELARHYIGALPHNFQLQFSPGELSSADDWTNIGTVQTNVFSITDPTQRLYGKSLEMAYRIKLTDGDSNTFYSKPAVPLGHWNKHDFLIVREVVRKERLMTSKFTAVEGFYFKQRRYGTPCPDCLDPLTDEVLNADCTTCYGTGITGGYYTPLASTFMDVTNEQSREDRGERGVERTTSIFGRFIEFPTPIQRDFFVAKASDLRYHVHSIKVLEAWRGYPFVWTVELRQAPLTDIIYTIPTS